MPLGLRLLLMDNDQPLPQKCDHMQSPNQSVDDGSLIAGLPLKLQPLTRAICLHNPFWNDFRLLHFLERRGYPISLEQLNYLKEQAGVGSRTEIYHELLQLHTDHQIELNEQQIRFIERLNPAFCDRDLAANKPGELLIYECLSSRRLHHKFKGTTMYLHLFIDMFNGYIFGTFHPERSSQAGFNILLKTILPFYYSHKTVVSTVLCSQKSLQPTPDFSAASIAESAKYLGVSWQHTQQSFGTIESFHKYILRHFFEGIRLYETPYPLLEASFKRWLLQYNLEHPFTEHRDFLSFVDFDKCFVFSLDQ